MTNDSKNIRCAINYLEELKCHTSGYAVEWLDMAIRALNVIQGMEEAFWQALPVLDMRDATEEERNSLKHYISQSTGVKIEIEPCVDCVNRLDVLAILLNAYNESRFDGYSDYCAVSDLVADLPSIKPQRPQGKWIEQNDTSKHHFGWYYCSNCGAYLMSADGANYCSCCGAEMEDSND